MGSNRDPQHNYGVMWLHCGSNDAVMDLLLLQNMEVMSSNASGSNDAVMVFCLVVMM